VLRRQPVHYVDPLVASPDEEPHGTGERLGQDLLPGQTPSLLGKLGVHLPRQAGGIGHQGDEGILVVLGLGEEVRRDKTGIRRTVSQYNQLARAGQHVDPHRAVDLALRFRDVGVARPGDHVHPGNRPGAVGERRDRLRAPDAEDPRDSRDLRGRQDHVGHLPARR